jgi:hypothetical protein
MWRSLPWVSNTASSRSVSFIQFPVRNPKLPRPLTFSL